MQWDNLTLVRKWHEYVGPKDERLEAEEAKVYKTGFMLLSTGTLVLLIYQLMAQQVAWIHKDDGASYDMFANPVEAAMYIWFVVVMVACAIMQARKGYVDTNRFGQTEKFPAQYFTLISGLSGLVSAVAIFVMRTVAEIQFVPFEQVFLVQNLVMGAAFGVLLFFVTYGAFYLQYRSAKSARDKMDLAADNTEE